MDISSLAWKEEWPTLGHCLAEVFGVAALRDANEVAARLRSDRSFPTRLVEAALSLRPDHPTENFELDFGWRELPPVEDVRVVITWYKKHRSWRQEGPWDEGNVTTFVKDGSINYLYFTYRPERASILRLTEAPLIDAAALDPRAYDLLPAMP